MPECYQCAELLTSGKMSTKNINFENVSSQKDIASKEEFISSISRGGLIKPSDVMYIACIHGYTLYKKIRENNDAFNFLLSTLFLYLDFILII